MWKFVIIAVFSSLSWATISSEGKFHDKGCGNTLSANFSGFELNQHNLSEPCDWTIKPNVTGNITLFFYHVFLHENDSLNLYRSLGEAESHKNPILEKPIPSQNGTITFITNETEIVIYVVGKDRSYSRVLKGYYSVHDCSSPVPPDVGIVYAPTYIGHFSGPVECEYSFNEIQHERVKQVFTFEEFNMSSSVIIDGGDPPHLLYKNDFPTDFFTDDGVLTIKVTQALNSTDHFKLKIHKVDKSCSGIVKSPPENQLISPTNILNNGTVAAYECRWLVQNAKTSNKLGLKFDKLDFSSVFDIIAVNDGASELSPPLLQVTTSNRNMTQNQVVRGSHSYLWVSFKPLSYKSKAVINITVHEQGGYFKNIGDISMGATTGDDTAFLLEVEDNEVVMLNFEVSSIKPPATVTIYDGFDTSNLLTTIHGEIKFPVLSRSSRMMVTGTKFSDESNHFSAKFKGVVPGCNYMSSLSAESYILSENCNASCVWIIPPQNSSNSALMYLQYISLKEGDNIKIHKLDPKLTILGEIGSNETHIPHISVPADVGLLVNITQATCQKNTDKIVLIGHSSYIPACNHNIIPKASEFLQISSPLYPDTYPVFASCRWNISASKDSIVHMTFQNLNLAKNHCIKIAQNSSKPTEYEGKTLPSDLFLKGDILIDFDSSGCNKTEVGNTLNSDTGFLLNVTVADCGAVLDGRESGEFNTSVTGNKTTCIWKISVPPTTEKSVNIISYVVNKKDKLENYELHVYDGSSVRDSKIMNNTDSTIWSRTNTLIFVYKRLNASKPSSVLVFNYKTISCNASMQCNNKVCMHPDWRCNGVDDCGDFSDETNCASVPIPPEVKYTGYSATAFWLCIIAMVAIGVILGVTVPVCYQRYKDSRYRRFQELDS